MATTLGCHIEALRTKLGMNQGDFGKLFDATAMSVSRWERDVNPPGSRELLTLGLLARSCGLNGWRFWEMAGITRADARAMLHRQARAAGAGC